MLQLIADLQWHREAEEQRRQNDARAELASTMRYWFSGELARLWPGKNQLSDTVLGNRIGLPHTGELLHKASRAMRFYGRTSEVERKPRGTRVRVALNCRDATPAKLRRAFAKVDKLQLRQMRNADLKTAGLVLDADVNDDGIVDLACIVYDPTAALKVAERAYTGVLVTMDGDEIADVSLVDSPVGFLEKADWPDGAVIAKIYNGGGKLKDKDIKLAQRMSKANGLPPAANYDALKKVRPVYAPALPRAVEAALASRQAAEDAFNARPNEFTKAAFVRADTATRIAVIAAQRPAAVGDGGLIRFLRHGRA
jgi:hypothetical protein